MSVPEWIKPSRRGIITSLLLVIIPVFGIIFAHGQATGWILLVAVLYFPAILLEGLLQLLSGHWTVLTIVVRIVQLIVLISYVYLFGCAVSHVSHRLSRRAEKILGVIAAGVIFLILLAIWWPPTPAIPSVIEGQQVLDCGDKNVALPDSQQRQCFEQAAATCNPARLNYFGYTVEGDLINHTYWIDENCKYHLFTDSDDRFGVSGKFYSVCDEFNTNQWEFLGCETQFGYQEHHQHTK